MRLLSSVEETFETIPIKRFCIKPMTCYVQVSNSVMSSYLRSFSELVITSEEYTGCYIEIKSVLCETKYQRLSRLCSFWNAVVFLFLAM